jgi:D-aminoacyl-tRNA deacylase
MKVVIQRVSESSVSIDNQKVGQIEKGYLILLGIAVEDNISDITWLVNKIVNLRIFSDDLGLMNKSIKEIKGSILLISQFTLYASTKKGNRPSFIKAARPEQAIPLYEQFINQLRENDITVECGQFGTDMKVALINDGPVTIVIDSHNKE